MSVCTPSEFRVNEKLTLVTACVSNGVQPVHRLLTGFGANARAASHRKASSNSLSRRLHLPGLCWVADSARRQYREKYGASHNQSLVLVPGYARPFISSDLPRPS